MPVSSINNQFISSLHQIRHVPPPLHPIDISDVCEHISVSQIQEATATLNKGKAPDYYGVQVEHLLYGGDVDTSGQWHFSSREIDSCS